ncbi:MAG: hypothetical protein HFJ45_03220 [Clostridia bacterium]|nr:hypothetical protein [Clostridia bacterium]
MRKDKGIISVFALFAMMFFLIFIMISYNNVAIKGKNQIETTGVLVDCYKNDLTAEDILSHSINGGSVSNIDVLYKKSNAEKSKVDSLVTGEYIFLHGKIYKK